jgi:hypothetical protein
MYCASCANEIVRLFRQYGEIRNEAMAVNEHGCLSKALAIAEKLGVGSWSARDAASLGKKVH